MGRAKLAKKKIIRECFTEKGINFVQRVSKQLLLTEGESSELAGQIRLMTIRVINNYGLDFKQFVYREDVLDKLVEIIENDIYC